MIDAFIDTNVFLYAASEAPEEAEKARVARELIETSRFGISMQVIQEFYVNATGRLAKTIPEQKVQAVLELLKQQVIAPITVELFESARVLKLRFDLSYWDAAILAAAKALGAGTVYSEDLSHGQDYDGVRVVNPFRNRS